MRSRSALLPLSLFYSLAGLVRTASLSRLQTIAASVTNAKVPYLDPKELGGSMLTGWVNSSTLGEPLNIIVSARSSPEVLTLEGFKIYMNSLNVSFQCLGQVGGLERGSLMDATVNGSGNQTEILTWRENFGNSLYGTCLQTFVGGWHFRLFNQTKTGALFLAASIEHNLAQKHMIVANGYDLGRDWMVAKAIQPNGTWIQTTMYSTAYTASVENVTDMLPPGSTNINHGIATDGRTAVLTIQIKHSSTMSLPRSLYLSSTLLSIYTVMQIL